MAHSKGLLAKGCRTHTALQAGRWFHRHYPSGLRPSVTPMPEHMQGLQILQIIKHNYIRVIPRRYRAHMTQPKKLRSVNAGNP